MADLEVVKPKTETHFSWMRTRMSVERTLMSWVRTATALIGFGFTIFQFFEKMAQMEGVAAARHPRASRLLALSLIGIGTAGLIMALVVYRQTTRYLHGPEFARIVGEGDQGLAARPTVYAAALLVVVGVVAFGAILLRT
jgi:putative membrane protein